MRWDRRALLALGLLAACAACAAAEAGPRSLDDPLPARADADDGWVLVLADEFDEGRLDTSLWFPRSGDLVHPKTLNSASPEMVSVRDGSLFVSAVPTPHDPAFSYTAGYLDTRGLFAQTYGKFEVRARYAFAPGLWYAVWSRPWTNPVPEIDIEFLADDVTQVWFVNHWALPPLPADDRRSFVTVDGVKTTDFHTYTVVWTPELVEWQVDGRAYKRVTGRGVPHEPMVWIVNAWVGGWGGPPSPSTRFPASFEVDWFRAYRMAAWPVEPSIRVAKGKTTYALDESIAVEIADLERSARVEVWEGDALVATMSRAPFKLAAKNLGRGAHRLTLVGTDGAREARAAVDVLVK